ncbi:hypothetical protein NL108_017658 [Boleophthalmus pectinirostris]|uniref:zinc finger protein 354C-like n=1 Tax=Boleophthalmus pectinirostris TaxID=150288 RepID=UPI000A1C4BD1|nr:zinc finger protein 354C-like [Boleophthalmus pectinirostris]KAJ0064923.1 hypothetical protein NL108_017658 [Boleophthalmus pectinirostris]
MSAGQTLRNLVNARLCAAAEDIFALFERTIAEYEEELRRSKEENQRNRELLQAVLNPRVTLIRAAVQSTAPGLDHGLSEGLSQDLDQGLNQGVSLKIRGGGVVKEEPEEQGIKHEEEQLRQSVQESSSVCVKEEELSLFHQTEPRDETQGEDISTQTYFLPEMANDEDLEPFSYSATYMELEADQVQMRTNSLNSKPSLSRNKHQCPICKKKFTCKYYLKIHNNIHTGAKPFSCSFCKKTFSDASTLRRHVRVHTGQKPYRCSICNKAFAQNYNRTVHMRTHAKGAP